MHQCLRLRIIKSWEIYKLKAWNKTKQIKTRKLNKTKPKQLEVLTILTSWLEQLSACWIEDLFRHHLLSLFNDSFPHEKLLCFFLLPSLPSTAWSNIHYTEMSTEFIFKTAFLNKTGKSSFNSDFPAVFEKAAFFNSKTKLNSKWLILYHFKLNLKNSNWQISSIIFTQFTICRPFIF